MHFRSPSILFILSFNLKCPFLSISAWKNCIYLLRFRSIFPCLSGLSFWGPSWIPLPLLPIKVGLPRSRFWSSSLPTLSIPYRCSSMHLASINFKLISLAQTLLSSRPFQFSWDQRISWDTELSVLRLRKSQANQNESVTLETLSTS